MKLKVETPPNLIGTAEQQLRTIYSYLFRLAENLNVALSNLEADNGSSAAQPSGNTKTESASISGDAYYELRALILNTADSILKDVEQLRTDMGDSFDEILTAWSSVQEKNDSRLTALEDHAKTCAEHQLETDKKLEQLETKADAFATHQTLTEKYITFDEEQGVMEVSAAVACSALTINGQALNDYILAVVNAAGAEDEGSEGTQ